MCLVDFVMQLFILGMATTMFGLIVAGIVAVFVKATNRLLSLRWWDRFRVKEGDFVVWILFNLLGHSSLGLPSPRVLQLSVLSS